MTAQRLGAPILLANPHRNIPASSKEIGMARLHSRILYTLMGISLLFITTGARADGYYAGIVGGQTEFEAGISAGKGTTINNKSSASYLFFGW